MSAVVALLPAEGKAPQHAIDAIQGTARNFSKNARLGLGIVDAAAAVKSSGQKSSSQKKTSRPSQGGGRRGGRRRERSRQRGR